MSLTKILSIAESVGIQDQKFVGQVISRNQRISTSEILSVQPFQFDIKPMNYLLLSQNKDLLSELRVADRLTEQLLNFKDTGWINYIAYQGDMSEAEIIACEYQAESLNKAIVLGNLPSIADTDYIVKAGDYLQIGRYSYIATENVLRGVDSTVAIPVHRTILTAVTTSDPVVIGQYGNTTFTGYTGITFPVVLTQYPTYTLIPMTNDSFIAWNSSFIALELVLN
jgi:hypothetical protein